MGVIRSEVVRGDAEERKKSVIQCYVRGKLNETRRNEFFALPVIVSWYVWRMKREMTAMIDRISFQTSDDNCAHSKIINTKDCNKTPPKGKTLPPSCFQCSLKSIEPPLPSLSSTTAPVSEKRPSVIAAKLTFLHKRKRHCIVCRLFAGREPLCAVG